MPPTHLAPSAKPPSGRYLTFSEREDIAIELAKGNGARAIARKLGRSPSTISRELRRNASTRGGNLDYRASTAQWHADRASMRPRPGRSLPSRPIGRDGPPPASCRPSPNMSWPSDRIAGSNATSPRRICRLERHSTDSPSTPCPWSPRPRSWRLQPAIVGSPKVPPSFSPPVQQHSTG